MIAKTILAQLGGNHFLAMTGARNLVALHNGLQFDLPPGAINKARKVQIVLSPSDTYTVAFYKWNARKLSLKLIDTVNAVYADNLTTVFTGRTGLDTHL